MIIVDIGNSSAKCAQYAAGQYSSLERISTDKLVKYLAAFGEEVLIASVLDADKNTQIFRELSQYKIKQHWLNQPTFLIESAYLGHAILGIDRYFAMLGANQHACPAIVVDIGSAATIDIIEPSNKKTLKHCGGWIVPGFALSAQALQQTDQIQHVELAPVSWEKITGNNTKSCINKGLLLEKTALIQWVAGSYNYPVILTGGGAPLLKEALQNLSASVSCFHEPLLIHQGIVFYQQYMQYTSG